MKRLLITITFFSHLLLSAQTSDPGVTSTGNAGGNHAFRGIFTNGTFSNWLNSGYDGTAHNLLGHTDPHGGYGIITGNNIVSPMIWMYNNINNAFIVKSMNYQGDMTSGSELFIVRAMGNVGVGINAPASKFHVYSNTSYTSSNNGLTIEEDGTGDALLHFLLTQEQRWVAGIDNSDNNKFIIGRGADWAQGKDLIISNSGLFGFGITSPSEKISVNGNVLLSNNYFLKGTRIDGNKSNLIGFTQEGSNHMITISEYTSVPSEVRIYAPTDLNQGISFFASNQLAFLRNDGDMMLGTGLPANRLHLSNLDVDGINLDNKFRIRSSNLTSDNFVLEHIANTGNLYIRSIETGDISGDIVLNDLGGNVSIGLVNSPTAKLNVNGDILAEEVKVVADVNNVPDYVFEEGYQLNTLQWTEEYIKSNHHLPEIPSAAEIAENGLNLGDMELKLLQKIEELTLYIIQQNKEIETLKSTQKTKEEAILQQLSVLMKEIEALKAN